MTAATARQEWATMWALPLVCMLGITGSSMFAYAGGVYMQSVTREFGWSRAQYSSAFLVMMVSGLVLAPATGWLVDRVGPRRVVLGAIIPFAATISLFGLVHGALWQWYAICLVLAVFQGGISQIVWVKAIVSRFDHARGMAVAVTLAGLGLGSFIWPVLAAVCIEKIGWRWAFPAMAALYLVIAFPLVIRFFHASPDQPRIQLARSDRPSIGTALLSSSFIGLAIAAGLFAAANYGLTVHFVPILSGTGIELKTAAAVAGLIGIFSIIGRLGTGILLDRLPTRMVGVIAFLLPLGSVACLLCFPGKLPAAFGAAAILGLGSGAELDIITYIVARRFGREMFGAIYAAFMAIVSVSASFGPVIAGATFDATHSYAVWLALIAPMVIGAAAIIGWMPISVEDGLQRWPRSR